MMPYGMGRDPATKGIEEVYVPVLVVQCQNVKILPHPWGHIDNTGVELLRTIDV